MNSPNSRHALLDSFRHIFVPLSRKYKRDLAGFGIKDSADILITAFFADGIESVFDFAVVIFDRIAETLNNALVARTIVDDGVAFASIN